MAVEPGYQVDLESETILYEGEQLDRTALADRIRRMIEQQDYRISAAGNALQHLEEVLSSARQLEVRLTAAEADRLERHARRAELSPAAFLRQAALAYLAAQPPLDADADTPAQPPAEPGPETQPTLTAITTEPVEPEAAEEAVELTPKRSSEADTAAGSAPPAESSTDGAAGESAAGGAPEHQSKVVVDPALQVEQPDPDSIGDSWFKKE
jgi:hypothetical protein